MRVNPVDCRYFLKTVSCEVKSIHPAGKIFAGALVGQNPEGLAVPAADHSVSSH